MLPHVAVLLCVLLGRTVAGHAAPVAYLGFLPAVALHGRIDRNACLLGNLESPVRTGRRRNPANPEEGAWIATLPRSLTKLPANRHQADRCQPLAP